MIDKITNICYYFGWSALCLFLGLTGTMMALGLTQV